LTLCALAQSAELSGAYSHLTPGKDGFDASLAYLATKHLGLEGDVGGYFKTGDHVYNFVAGPKVMFSTHDALFTPFLHLLVGGVHEGSNYLGVLPGGGVDVGSKTIALRVKLDAMHFNSGTHARAGLGVVVRW
jgi:hypothetical protein